MADDKPNQQNGEQHPKALVAKTGDHRFGASLAPGRLGDSTRLLEVHCTCGQPSCGLASAYAWGLLEGFRQASIAAARAIRGRDSSAALLPPEVKLNVTFPSELTVNLKQPTAGVVIDYDQDGHVVGTRPRGTAQ